MMPKIFPSCPTTVAPKRLWVISMMTRVRLSSGPTSGRSFLTYRSLTRRYNCLPKAPPGWNFAKSSVEKPRHLININASASPMTSCAVVLLVGARLLGMASSFTVTSSTKSACEAKYDCRLPTIATIVLPLSLIKGTSTLISGVSPLFDKMNTISPSRTMPKSPWMASAACMKTALVPVEFIVATIFWAMMALFPMPENTKLPLLSNTKSTIFTKSTSTWLFNPMIALASFSII